MNKNNNPGNLRKSESQWKGLIGHDERNHCRFETPVKGTRAAARTWEAKWNAGKRTILDIYRSWAPKTDTIGSIPGNPQNKPDEGAVYIAQRCVYGVDQPLPYPADDVALTIMLLRALFRLEMGHECEMSVILQGVGEWLADFVEPRQKY